MDATTQRDLRRFRGLLNVRRSQTGARAAATQRKLEALQASLRARGVSRAEIAAELSKDN